MSAKFTIAGVGELLWDVFGQQKQLGGAPANFACHCSRLGALGYPVSCVGADALGTEIKEVLASMDVNTSGILTSQTYPTGTVQVTLDEDRKPTYEICTDVAWDHLPLTDDLTELAERLDAVCFGSLSQRSAESRDSIRGFIEKMPETALKIFDVNLRAPFYNKATIQQSLELANILKLSDEELPVLAEYFDLAGTVSEQINQLRERFDLRLIAYTRGAEGSLLVGVYEFDDFPGFTTKVVDSVGAGDSFTAALCMGILRGWPLDKVNTFANEVAVFVCSQKGATPVLPRHLVESDLTNGGK